MTKVQISLEEVKAFIDRRNEINILPLEDIEWTLDGVPVEMDPKEIDNFKYVGLSNVTFVEYYFRKKKWEELERKIDGKL